ncbi:MAG: TonB-dependent receptor [Opitutus sp.]
MNKLRWRKFGAAPSLFAIAGLLSITSARAQSSPTGATDDSPVSLERVEVTGSYIPYSVDAPAVPVRTVSVAEIEATGQRADLLEVIRKTVPQFIGNGNLGSANSNISGGSTNGGSQIKLRNVQTLVLINGRRAAFAPVGATGGFDFVDVNAIPVAAVERIEVLKDGASALYGSDAVSGVVNIILKKDYQGAELGGQYRFSSQGGKHWEERSGNFTVGAKSGKTSVTVSGEWVRSDPLFLSEREFSFDQTGKSSSFPGAVAPYFGDNGNYLLAPGKTAPLNTDLTGAELVAAGIYTKPTVAFPSLFNLNNATLGTGNEKFSVTTALSHQLTDNIELFGDLLYTRTDVFYQLNAQPIVGMPYFAQNVEGFGGPTGYTLAEHPQNPFDDMVLVRNRFVDYPRLYIHENDSIRGLAGARGKINDLYSWEVGANLNKVTQNFRNENVINRVALANAIDNGLINLFNREQNPTALTQANIFGTAFSRNQSSLISFDARLNGGFENVLPAGPILFAVGAETRRETLSANPDAGSFTIVDPNSPMFGQPTSWDGATTTDRFNVHRSVDSAFLEVRVPVVSAAQSIRGLHTLDLDLAVRHDKYSDTDDPTVPKVSLRWFPINDELAFRASYSKSFSAASLFSLFGPAGVGFTDQPIGLQFVDGRVMDDNVDQAFLRITSNPNLKPEKAKNYNVGLIYSPKGLKGFSVELNYFSITQDQIAGSVSEVDIMQDVETNGASSKYADRVRINSFNGAPITGPGQISAAFDQGGGSFTRVFVTNFSENFVSGKQDGVDSEINYTFDVPSVARFDVKLNGVWFNSFTVDGEEYVGTTNGNSVLNGGTIPRWLANLSVEMTRGNILGGFYITHIPSVNDTTAADDETDPTSDRHIESFTTVDVYLGYTFRNNAGLGRFAKGLQVRVGANNVFDKAPPLAKSSWTDSGADTSTYGAMGRILYVSGNIKF